MARTQGYLDHYRDFYAASGDPSDAGDERIGVIVGNCQAESLRIALESAAAHNDGARFVRIPPVHELEADDLPFLARLLARTSILISQPVRDNYRGLPLGTAQLRAQLPERATTALVPVIRFAGLYPYQVIIRPPSDTSLVPPLVPYHDLRILVEAADAGALPPASGDRIRAIAAESIRQLATREKANDTVVVSDLFARPDFEQMRTINHPGNPVWVELAERMRERLGFAGAGEGAGAGAAAGAGAGAPAGPAVRLDRPLLNNIHAPREQSVIDAFGLDAAPRDTWTVGGVAIDPAELRAAHLAWYREHPDAVRNGLERHALALTTLAAA